jgi:tetratricopeptide (TPR) repeat protein
MLNDALALLRRGGVDAAQLAALERAATTVLGDADGPAGALRLLAAIRLRQARHEEAVALLRAARILLPLAGEIALDLAHALLAAGEYVQALDMFRAAGPAAPRDRAGLALALVGADRANEALPHAQAAALTGDDAAFCQLALGLTLNHMCRPVEAIAALNEAVRLDPDSANAHDALAEAQIELRRPLSALASLDRALALRPAYPDALTRYGVALAQLGRPAEAIPWFERALEVNAAHAPAYRWMAGALSTLRLDTEALDCLRAARRLRPQWEALWMDEAGMLLRVGRLREGFAAYEHRETVRLLAGASEQYWSGQAPLDGRTLLVVAEQGLGDTLHFVRYIPLVARRAGRVVLEVQPPLLPLLAPQAEAWGVTLLARGAARPDHDYFCLLMSLPHALGTGLETIPAAQAYLRPSASARAAWRDALPDTGRLRVGVVCSGNPHYGNDAARSMPLAMLQATLDVAGVDWISLQPQLRPADGCTAARCTRWHDIGAKFGNFDDTAAVVEQLDLVISVDTSVAHLAGALGRPTWVLLPFVPDWRWLHDREDTPWYPSLRLFRQDRPNDWSHPVARVAGALAAMVRMPSPSACNAG